MKQISKEYVKLYDKSLIPTFSLITEFNNLNPGDIDAVSCDGFGNQFIYRDFNNEKLLGFIVKGYPKDSIIWYSLDSLKKHKSSKFMFGPPLNVPYTLPTNKLYIN